MSCFITHTGSFLPGPPISNDQIETYLGSLEGEEDVRDKVLRMNGIVTRHYAQDEQRRPTDDVYGMACKAIEDCLLSRATLSTENHVSYLAAGTTYAPFSGPGIGSILHDRLQQQNLLRHSVEISSHAGICTSAAAAMVATIRAVNSGEHQSALCVGSEFSSNVLKEETIQPIDDRAEHTELRKSKWFMSVFLRFMLSDGAGAFLVQDRPRESDVSFQVNWTHSRSFAHETPLCMKLENEGVRLSQDVSILQRHLFKCTRQFVAEAMKKNNDDLARYRMILPHLSSFFFRRKMEKVMQEFTSSCAPVPYWTNLATAGNTGAASIYVMLDEYLRTQPVEHGDRLMLFIPESGQFNFVLISLTAIVR